MGTFLLVTVALCWLPPPMNWLASLAKRFDATRKLSRWLRFLSVICYLCGLVSVGVSVASFIEKDGVDMVYVLMAVVGLPIVIATYQYFRASRQRVPG